MFCANCLTKNPDDAVRCVNCGAVLPVESPGAMSYDPAPNEPAAPPSPSGGYGAPAGAYTAPSGGYPAFPRYPTTPDEANMYPAAPAYPSAADAANTGGAASGLYGPYMPPQPYQPSQPYPGSGASGGYSQPVPVAPDGSSGAYSQPAPDGMSGAYSQPAPYPPSGAWGPYSQPASGASGAYPGYPAAYPSMPLSSAYPMYPPYSYAAPATRLLGPDESLADGAPVAKRARPLSGLRRALASRFPLPIAALALLVPLLIVGGVYAVETWAIGADWAHGARIAGFVALALAGLALLLTVLRLIVGRRAVAAVALGLALVVLLGALGAGGLFGGQRLHLAQAQQLEHAGKWAAAVNEYTLAGQKPPASGDLARIYDEWGESDLSQRLYPDAATRFTQVITDFSGAGAYATRAQHDLYRTYSAWITSGRTDVNYDQALLFLESYKNTESLCDTSCRGAVNTLETQACYQYGVELATRGSYALAITQFETAQALTPGSHYALLAYQAAAPAYYSLGQQDLTNGNCATALAAYQTLTSNYKNTPAAHQASLALAAPVKVTGDFTNYTPTGYIPTVFLSATANAPDSQNAAPGSYSFSDDYATTLDLSGTYTFTNVTPGNYTLSVVGATSTTWWLNDNNSLYFFPVTALCGAQVQALDGSLIS